MWLADEAITASAGNWSEISMRKDPTGYNDGAQAQETLKRVLVAGMPPLLEQRAFVLRVHDIAALFVAARMAGISAPSR